MRPTVLTEVNHDMLLMIEESFAPIMPVMRYQTDDEAIALANDTHYGLSAAVIAGTPGGGRRAGRARQRGHGRPPGHVPDLVQDEGHRHELVRRLGPRRRQDRPWFDPQVPPQEGLDDPISPTRPARAADAPAGPVTDGSAKRIVRCLGTHSSPNTAR
jgi:hypothetical protein